MKRLILLICLLLPFSVLAADDPDFCAVDSDHDGNVTQWCTATTDKDNDGEPDATDCDPENSKIYPGVAVSTGCSAGNAKVCQSDGTYGVCSSGGYCPSWATKCWYVSTTGSNSNAGTFAAPFADPAKLTYYKNIGDRPSGWIGLGAGEVILYRGGTYSFTYMYDTESHHFRMHDVDSLSNAPAGLMAYPGETVEFTTDVKYFTEVYQSDNFFVRGFKVHGIDIDGGAVVNCDASAGLYVENNQFYALDTEWTTNDAAVRTNACNGQRIRHNDCWDVKDTAFAPWHNTVCYLDFNSDDVERAYNSCVHSSSTSGEICDKVKHYINVATVPNIHHNSFSNCRGACTEYSGSVWLHHNRIKCAENDCSYADFSDMGGNTCYADDTIVEYNTIFGGRLKIIPDTDQCAIGNFIHRYNDFTQGDNDGIMIDVSYYGSDSHFTDFVTGGKWQSDHNLYDATGTSTLRFDFFPGGGNLGWSETTFAGWQSRGYDASGVEEPPAHNSSNCATSTNGTDKGVCAGAVPTPSPTPAATPTPTPTPNPGLTYVFTQ